MKENETIKIMNAMGEIEDVYIKSFLKSQHGENNNITKIIDYIRKETVTEILVEMCNTIKTVSIRCFISTHAINLLIDKIEEIEKKYIPSSNNEHIKCKDCKHLMFSDCYGECSKGYKGIVRPDDYCEHGEPK